MSSLLETQRQMAKLIMQPMTNREGMRTRNRAAAEKISKPNDRLTGFERLEIYNRGYWFRVLDCLAEDFPGVIAIIGAPRFRRMSEAYLAECPSRSFTLRNLGSRLGEWLRANPKWMGGHPQLVLDMVALEWAHIEAFDALQRPPITPEELSQAGGDLRLQLQPYIKLLNVYYPVEQLSLTVRDGKRAGKMVRTMSDAPLPQSADIFVAVHRADYSVHYKRLEPEAYRLLIALQNGAGLLDAVEAAFENSALPEEEQAQSVESWFRLWQSLGWFCSGSTKSTDSAKDNHGASN